MTNIFSFEKSVKIKWLNAGVFEKVLAISFLERNRC